MNSAMVIIGLGLIALGAILILLAILSHRITIKGGGIVLIGPFPIIFGDKSLGPILLIFAAIAVLFFLLLIVLG